MQPLQMPFSMRLWIRFTWTPPSILSSKSFWWLIPQSYNVILLILEKKYSWFSLLYCRVIHMHGMFTQVLRELFMEWNSSYICGPLVGWYLLDWPWIFQAFASSWSVEWNGIWNDKFSNKKGDADLNSVTEAFYRHSYFYKLIFMSQRSRLLSS